MRRLWICSLIQRLKIMVRIFAIVSFLPAYDPATECTIAAFANSQRVTKKGKQKVNERTLSDNFRHTSLVRWLLGSPDASATNLNLKDSFSTTDCSTKAFERRIADTGQMNSAAITRNPVELKRRILMVSLKISNALRELKRVNNRVTTALYDKKQFCCYPRFNCSWGTLFRCQFTYSPQNWQGMLFVVFRNSHQNSNYVRDCTSTVL